MARNLDNQGNIKKRKDGRYEVRVSDPVTGRRRSIFTRSEGDALAALKAAYRNIDDGIGIGDARLSFGAYLDTWLDGVRGTVRDRTHQRYEGLLRHHAKPHLGRLRLKALTPAHLRKLYGDLQKERPAAPGKKARKGLSPRSVGHVHRVIHAALKQAARDGLTPRNVAALVSPPRVGETERVMMSAEQLAALLKAIEGDRLEALYMLTLTSGLREGELLGLKWDSVDLVARTVTVRRNLVKVDRGVPFYEEPKTRRSWRTVTLTAVAVDALRKHRTRQKEERLKAIGWDDRDLVFADKIGREQHASNFYRDGWKRMRTEAGLPAEMTFHDLRHAFASLQLAAGVPITTVSAMLGHANTGITLRIYAHAVPGSQQQAADAMDAIIAKAAGT